MRGMAHFHDDDGFTLVEFLVTIVLLSIVMSIAAGSAVHAMKVQRRQVAEVETLARTRIAMERITREARAANPLIVAEPYRLDVQVTRGNLRSVTRYELVGDELLMSRSVTDMGTSTTTTSPSRPLLRGLQMDPNEHVFTYTTVDGASVEPVPGSDLLTIGRVGITLRLPLEESARPVLLQDIVTVRNAPEI